MSKIVTIEGCEYSDVTHESRPSLPPEYLVLKKVEKRVSPLEDWIENHSGYAFMDREFANELADWLVDELLKKDEYSGRGSFHENGIDEVLTKAKRLIGRE